MASVRRVVSVWPFLHLSVGSGVIALTQAHLDRTVEVPLVLGAICALTTAVVVLHQYPELEFSMVRRFGCLTVVLFITGHVIVADGFTAPPGERSPLTIGLLWLVSMAVAYASSAEKGHKGIVKRLPFR